MGPLPGAAADLTSFRDAGRTDPGCPLSGRYRAISGQHMLNTSSSEIDPLLTLQYGFCQSLPLAPILFGFTLHRSTSRVFHLEESGMAERRSSGLLIVV
jgi:hypothetical protein